MPDRAASENKFNDIRQDYRKSVLSMTYAHYDEFSPAGKASLDTLCNFFCRLHTRYTGGYGDGAMAVGQLGPYALPATLPSPLPAVLPREDRAAFEASVAHLGRDSAKAIINVVAQKLFTGQELETHSLTGKRPIKSGEAVRPPLDSVRLDLLQQLVRSKCPELTHKLFVETLQNLQKVIRKKTVMAVLKTDVA